MKKLFLMSLTVIVFVFGTAPSAIAVTHNTQMKIWLVISKGCGIVATTVVNFGAQPLIADTRSGAGSVSLICSVDLLYNVALDGGQSRDVNARHMVHSNGVNKIDYQLYQDPAHRNVWGDDPPTFVSGVGTGYLVTLPVYAVIHEPQNPLPGNYVDVVTVTLTFYAA